MCDLGRLGIIVPAFLFVLINHVGMSLSVAGSHTEAWRCEDFLHRARHSQALSSDRSRSTSFQSRSLHIVARVLPSLLQAPLMVVDHDLRSS